MFRSGFAQSMQVFVRPCIDNFTITNSWPSLDLCSRRSSFIPGVSLASDLAQTWSSPNPRILSTTLSSALHTSSQSSSSMSSRNSASEKETSRNPFLPLRQCSAEGVLCSTPWACRVWYSFAIALLGVS